MDPSNSYEALVYQPFDAQRQHFDPSIAPPAWHRPHHSPANPSPVDHSRMYPNSLSHVEYASPSTSFVHHTHAFVSSNQPSHMDGTHVLNLDGPPIESSIGPSRVLTRRQTRSSQVQPMLSHSGGRDTSAERGVSRDNYDSQQQQQSSQQMAFYMPSSQSRPQTPDNYNPAPQYQQHPNPSADGVSPMTMHPHQHASPQYPSPPTPVAGYGFPYYPTHSRSNSGSANSVTNPRSASPALSVASALTTVSSASGPNMHNFGQFSQGSPSTMSPAVGRPGKQRKQRLFNVDRKAICVFHKENPTMRQEDIAARYGVERSTISKILKQKTKWMNVPEGEELRVAKHRPSKFPEIESELANWLLECHETKTILSDSNIRAKAKQVSKALQIPDDKFKASSGWVENFKHRHGIKRGVWHGYGLNTRRARALGCGGTYEDEEPPQEEEPQETIGDFIARKKLYDLQNALVPSYKIPVRPLDWRPGPPPPGVIIKKTVPIMIDSRTGLVIPSDEKSIIIGAPDPIVVESEDEEDPEIQEIPREAVESGRSPSQRQSSAHQHHGCIHSPITIDSPGHSHSEDRADGAADTSVSSTSSSSSSSTSQQLSPEHVASSSEAVSQQQMPAGDGMMLSGSSSSMSMGQDTQVGQMTDAEFNYALYQVPLVGAENDQVPDAAEAEACFNKVMKYINAHPELPINEQERKVLYDLRPRHWGLGPEYASSTTM
ncbi:hypothetical protein EVG20_g3397 [Dentipellis fragilis]|uniref:HTH CENPB-type domain-containing protein n=1 Tax=Dentipellis fragilis TaxID=205917 RepID=A0A4Y9Z2S3_9AGAM|nr:hypothetical protein EVG20_g3397 [Dentipellis fragilis]